MSIISGMIKCKVASLGQVGLFCYWI